MSANFPNSPTLNQIFTYNGSSWIWNGRYWQAQTVAELAGSTGPIGATGLTGSTGATGPSGLGFTIAKIYANVASILADLTPTGIIAGQFAIIDNGNYNDPENSRLYLWTGNSWTYTSDLSGAQGIQGPAGSTGLTGATGLAGSAGATGATGIGATGATGPAGTSANVEVYDEGNLLVGTVTSLNFVGAGITANATGTNVTVTVTATGTGGFYYANTTPASPQIGDRWVNSDTLREFVYVNDGDSSQWIETVRSSQQGATGATGPGANLAALSGNLIPAANIAYDLGTASMRWRDLYLSGNTIFLGAATLGSTGNAITLPSGTKIGNNPVATTADVATIASGTSPKVANVQVADASWNALDDTAIDTAGGYILVNGSGFLSNPQVYVNNVPAGTVTFVSNVQLRVQVPATSAGTYPLYVINPDGGTAIMVPGISFSGMPSWTSPAAGSIATAYELGSVSSTFSANSNSAITYYLNSGFLPPGVSINSGAGTLSGTTEATASTTTYNFVIEARDAENQSTLRNFSITVNPDVVNWLSPANGVTVSAYEYDTVTQALSANSATNRAVAFSSATLPPGLSVSGNNITGTATTVSNIASNITATSATTNRVAYRTINFNINQDQVTWTTPANAAVITGYEFSNVTQALAATSAANRAVTFSGTGLPANVAVSGNSVTGTLGAVGNTNSTLTATAATTNRSATRSVTFQAIPDVVTWTAPTNNQTITIQASDTVNQALSAASAAGKSIAYSANNLPTGLSVVGSAVTGTPTGYTSPTSVTSNLTATATVTNRSSTISITWTINLGVIFTDAFFSNVSLLLNATSNASVISDASSNNLQLTPVGDVRASTFSPYNTGWSVQFDGTGDYIVANNPSIGTGDFSIESWAYFLTVTGDTNYRTIYSNYGSGGAQPFIFGMYVNTTPYLLFYDGVTNNTGVTPLVANTWYHFLATRRSGVLKLFLNGVLEYTGANTMNISAGTARIGMVPSASQTGYMNGYISNLRVCVGFVPTDYHTTSTTIGASIFTVANSNLSNVSQGAAGVQLLACQSNRFIDNSTNNTALVRNGDAAVRAFNPFNLTNTGTQGSMYFDGTGDRVLSPSSSVFAFTGTWTIEGWFYVATTIAARLWQMSDDKDNCEANNGGTGYINYYNGGASVNSGAAVFAPFSWFHLAAVCISNTTRIYVNGTLVVTHTTSNSSARSINIGGNSNLDYLGYVADFRVVTNRAMYPTAYPEAALTTANNTVLLLNNSVTNAATNNTFLDSSANNFAITRNGNATQGSFSPFSNSGWSVYFDGTGDYLTVPDNAVFDLAASDFVVEAWAYSQSSADYKMVMGQWGTSNISYTLRQVSSRWVFTYTTNNSTEVALTGTTTQQLNTWAHICAVRTGNTMSLFVNGLREATASASGVTIYNNTAAFSIGAGSNGADTWVGYVGPCRVIKGTLPSGYDATQVFLTVPTQPFASTASTAIIACQSNRFLDSSTNNFTITRNGDSRITAFSPFVPVAYTPAIHGGSAYFDGSGDFLSTPSNAAFAFGTGDFTIEGWFYFTGTMSTYQRPWWFSDDNDNAEINASVLRIGGASQSVLIAGPTMLASTWYHIALSRDSGTYRLYVNGTLAGSATNSYNSSARSLHIMALNTGSNPSTGYVSNFRVVKGFAIYTGASATVPTTPVTAVYGTQLLLNATNAGIWDASGRNIIETVGDAKVVAGIGRYTNSSVNFDGTGDFLTIPYSQNFNFGTGDFTVECWANITYVQYAAIITSTAVSIVTGHWLLGYSNTANQMAFGIDSSGVAVVGADYSPYLSTWTHIAASRSGTTLRLFFNGVQVASVTNSTNFTGDSGNPIAIGRRYTNQATYPLNGYISDLRITAGQALYTNTFSVPTRTLTNVDRTQLLTLQNNQPHNNHSFQDSSAYNHVITRSGNASQGTFSPFSPGGWSVFFDGSGDSLSVPQNSAFDFGTGQFTIEAWVNIAVGGTVKTIVAKWLDLNDNWLVRIETDNTVRLYYPGSNAVQGGALSVGRWQHVAITRDSSNLVRIFIDGLVTGSATLTTNFVNNAILEIGSYANNSNNMNGYISNLRILKGTAVYTAAFTPPTAPLTAIANTVLLTCQDNRFVDRSTSAVTFTRNGDTRVVAWSPFTPTASYTPAVHGGSAYFDGTGDYLTSPTGNAALNAALDILGGDYTIELWFYPLTSNPETTILTNFTSSGVNGWTFGTRIGAISLNHWVSNVNTEKLSAAPGMPAGQWFHLAVVKFNGNYFFYINGVDSGMYSGYTRTSPANGGAGTGLGVGAYIQNLSFPAYTQGYVSGIRVVKGSAVYTANFALPTTQPSINSNVSLLMTFVADAIEDRSARGVLETVADTRHSRAVVKFANTSSMYFDGSGDYVYTSRMTPLGSGDFTIELWCYTTIIGTNTCIFDLSDSGTSGFMFRQNTNNSILVYNRNASTNILVTSNNSIATNVWQHIAVVRSAGTITVYVNGVNVGSGANSVNYTQTGLYLGAFIGEANSPYAYTGYIQDLRITRAARYQPAVPTANLSVSSNSVLLVPGNTANTVIRDSSANNFQLTPFGDSRASNFTPYGTGWSAYFDGTGDYLTTTTSSAFNFGAGDFTVECWFYTTSIGQQHSLIDLRTGNNNGWVFYVVNDNTIAVYDGAVALGSTATIAAGTWYHIAWTRSGTALRIYLNGLQIASGTNSRNNATDVYATIGASYGGSGGLTLGYISTVRVVKGTAVYTANFVPPTAPLTAIANTSLLTCHTNRFRDGSTNNFTITRNGDTAVRSFNPFNITNTGVDGSMYFDGNGDYVTVPSSASLGIGASDYTIEGWFYTTDVSALRCVVTYGSGAFRIFFNASNIWFLVGGSPIFQPTGVIVPYLWNHMAIVRSGSGTNNTACFLNGTRVAQATNTSNFGTAALTIGAEGAGSYYIGYMSNLRLVIGTALYDPSLTTYTVPTAPLTAVANTQLLTLQYRQPPNNHGFLDSSSNQFLITRSGNASQGTFSPFSPSGWSVFFNGSSGITLPNNSLYGIAANTDFCWEAFIYMTSLPGTNGHYAIWNNRNAPLVSDCGWQFGFANNSGTYAIVGTLTSGSTDTNVGINLISQATATANQWHHIALVRSNGVIYGYWDGVSQGTLSYTSSINAGAGVSGIGWRPNGYNDLYFSGYISNFRFVNGNAVYPGGASFIPSMTGLPVINNTYLLTAASGGYRDLSPQNATVSAQSTPRVVAFSPFTPAAYTPALHGGSSYFDGTGDYLDIADNAGFAFGTGDGCIEFWYYPLALANYLTLLCNRTTVNSGDLFLHIVSDGSIAYYESGTQITAPAGTLKINSWVHLAFVRRSGTRYIYANGTSVASGAVANVTSQKFRIGASQVPDQFLNGYIAALRVVKGSAVYAANFTAPAAPLTATTDTSLLLNFTDAAIQDLDSSNVLETVADAREVNFGPLMSNYSVYFDGTGDYLTTPSNAAFAFGTGDFTVEAWVYVTGTNYCEVYTTASGSFPTTAMRLMITNAQKLQFYDGTNSATSTGSVLLNSWTHVALSRSGTSVRLFINGTQDGTTTSSNNLTQQIGYIGRTWDSFDFTGYISNLRIIKGIALYTVNFTPPTAPLTAVPGTSLLTCHANRFRDGSTNNFAITRSGDAKVTDFSPFGAQTANPPAISFDGTGDYLFSVSNPTYAFGTGNFTVELWLYLTAQLDAFDKVVQIGTSGQAFAIEAQATVNLLTITNFVDTVFVTSSTALVVGQWTHIAASRSGGTLRLFQNAVQVGSASNTTNFGGGSLYVGSSSSGQAITGYISDLRISRGVDLYGGFEPPTQPFATR